MPTNRNEEATDDTNRPIHYEVGLHHCDYGATATVVVREVRFAPAGRFVVHLVGTDPDGYPDWARESAETRQWTSADLTIALAEADPIEIVDISPTRDPLPEPEVTF